MKETAIGASEFKAKCLRLLDEVAQDGESVVITKRGKPVARLVPVEPEAESASYGDWKGKIKAVGDIVHFDCSDEWESLK